MTARETTATVTRVRCNRRHMLLSNSIGPCPIGDGSLSADTHFESTTTYIYARTKIHHRLTLFRRRYSPPKSQQSTRICGQLHHESRALRRRRCGWLGAGDACPAGGARAADRRATPRRAVKASTTGFCSRAPVLRDWWRTCAVHQHCRAANLGHGLSRASWHAGCLGANSEHAQPPHQWCSRVLRVCAYRDGHCCQSCSSVCRRPGLRVGT